MIHFRQTLVLLFIFLYFLTLSLAAEKATTKKPSEQKGRSLDSDKIVTPLSGNPSSAKPAPTPTTIPGPTATAPPAHNAESKKDIPKVLKSDEDVVEKPDDSVPKASGRSLDSDKIVKPSANSDAVAEVDFENDKLDPFVGNKKWAFFVKKMKAISNNAVDLMKNLTSSVSTLWSVANPVSFFKN